MVDRGNQTALSYAIARKNGTVTFLLLSTLCGLSGSTEQRVSAILTEHESSQMYAVLSEITSVDIGRTTALLALVNPDVVLVTIIRSSTAVRDRALLVERESPAQAEQLRAASRRFDAAITALLFNLSEVIVPNYTAKNQESGSLTPHSTRNLFDNSVNPSQGRYSHRELVHCFLKGSHAVELAVRYSHKPFFALSCVMGYMDTQWSGSLELNKRNTKEREVGNTKKREVGSNDNDIFQINSRVKHQKHGEGTVISRHRSGRLEVFFDDGEMHNYKPAKAMVKLTYLYH